MVRLIFMALIGFFLYRIVQTAARMFSSAGKTPREDDRSSSRTKQGKPTSDFKNIQDAEFEDITPKKDNDGSSSQRTP